MTPVERLLNPRHVAIIGASSNPSKLTGRPVEYLRRHGFAGEIFPVNPHMPAIPGLTCYPDSRSLPRAPDVGLVLVGQERAVGAVRDLAARGAGAAVVLSGGFGETGPAGMSRQRELRQAAGSMRLLGPNTIGLVNLTDRVMLSASGALELADLERGAISVVSQSGGILGSLLSRGADRGIGFAKLVSTGNEADIDVADIMEALIDDEHTRVIALYLEGLRRPEAFRAAATRAAAAGKPVVAFKVGRSESGARSAVSHTGALSGEDRLYDAMFRQVGVIRAETFSDLLDLPAALCVGRRAKGRRVAILTSTGGAGTLVADACGIAGLDVPLPDAETAGRLAQAIGDAGAAASNPVDVTLAGLQPGVFRSAIAVLLDSPSYDALVVVAGSSSIARPDLVVDSVTECLALSDKPILVYASPNAPRLIRLLNRRNVPALLAPESCASALRALIDRPSVRPDLPLPRPPVPLDLTFAPGPLNEVESRALFARFGIKGVREATARDEQDAQAAASALGGPVVLKLLSRQAVHKSDIGGVAVGVAVEEVAERVAAIRKSALAHGIVPEGFLVQELVAGGMEMILGVRQDPQFGPIVLLGMGGVAAELLGDTSIRLVPLTRADAENMIRELKTAPLLEGYRGHPRRDVEALIEAILAFAQMAGQLGNRLAEAEINPLFVMADGQGVIAGDGLAVIA